MGLLRFSWKTLFLTFLLSCAGGCAAVVDGQVVEPPKPPAAGGPLAAELDPLVKELFALEMSPGLAVAVVRDGELAYLRGFGYADAEEKRPVAPEKTRFYIASTSKSFTGLTTALLAHKGVLDLDAPLSKYIPELEFKTELSADAVKIRDLLTMTDGTGQYIPFVFRTAFTGEFSEKMLIDLLSSSEPSPKGRAFAYRNQPYNILGMVIERATGLGWKEAVEREVLAPLGLTATSAYMSKVDRSQLALPYRVAPAGFERATLAKGDANMHAAGGHLTTALDLARWVEAFLGNGAVGGVRVFPAEVIQAATSVQAQQDRDFSFFHRHGWGYGWDIGTYEQETLVHRFGSFIGARPHVSFMPEHGIGVVALVNEAELGGRLVDLVATRIYDRLLGKAGSDGAWDARIADERSRAEGVRKRVAEDREKRARRQQPTPLPLEAYVGRYESEELGTMQWSARENGLEVSVGLARSPAEVYKAEEHAFRVELLGGPSVVTFLVDDEEVKGLVFLGFEARRVDR